jgi:ketosteroid isomerase-like protein
MKQTFSLITLAIAMSCFSFAQGKRSDVEEELLKLENEFTQANLKNDAEAIGRFLADDWVIIEANGAIIDKARFLGVIKSGDLSYQMMKWDEVRVRIYGETALVTGLTSTTGKFKGQELSTRERGTDVFIKRDGRWQCVFSQLTGFSKSEFARSAPPPRGSMGAQAASLLSSAACQRHPGVCNNARN